MLYTNTDAKTTHTRGEERKNRIVRWVVSHPYVFPASAHTYIYISFLSRSTYHILFTLKKKSIHIHFWHQNGVNKVSCFIDFLYLTWSTNAYMNSKHMHLFFFSYISVHMPRVPYSLTKICLDTGTANSTWNCGFLPDVITPCHLWVILWWQKNKHCCFSNYGTAVKIAPSLHHTSLTLYFKL